MINWKLGEIGFSADMHSRYELIEHICVQCFHDISSQTPWFAQRQTMAFVTWGFVATLTIGFDLGFVFRVLGFDLGFPCLGYKVQVLDLGGI